MMTSCAAEIAGAASASKTHAILNYILAPDRASRRRNMKILTAVSLAFDAVILGYDLLQIAWFLSLRA
jgi:hypothetical protein